MVLELRRIGWLIATGIAALCGTPSADPAPADENRLAALLADLDAESVEVRERASDSLAELCWRNPPLRDRALQLSQGDVPLEVRSRLRGAASRVRRVQFNNRRSPFINHLEILNANQIVFPISSITEEEMSPEFLLVDARTMKSSVHSSRPATSTNEYGGPPLVVTKADSPQFLWNAEDGTNEGESSSAVTAWRGGCLRPRLEKGRIRIRYEPAGGGTETDLSPPDAFPMDSLASGPNGLTVWNSRIAVERVRVRTPDVSQAGETRSPVGYFRASANSQWTRISDPPKPYSYMVAGSDRHLLMFAFTGVGQYWDSSTGAWEEVNLPAAVGTPRFLILGRSGILVADSEAAKFYALSKGVWLDLPGVEIPVNSPGDLAKLQPPHDYHLDCQVVDEEVLVLQVYWTSRHDSEAKAEVEAAYIVDISMR